MRHLGPLPCCVIRGCVNKVFLKAVVLIKDHIVCVGKNAYVIYDFLHMSYQGVAWICHIRLLLFYIMDGLLCGDFESYIHMHILSSLTEIHLRWEDKQCFGKIDPNKNVKILKRLYRAEQRLANTAPPYKNFSQLITVLVTHCGLVTPYGEIKLGQHWLR